MEKKIVKKLKLKKEVKEKINDFIADICMILLLLSMPYIIIILDIILH